MSNRDEITISLYDKYIVPNYGRFPIMPVKGNGSFLYDENDNQYLDFSGGIAVNYLGHSNEKMVQVLADQSSQLIHCSNLYQPRIQGELAKIITEEIIGYEGKCFFCNSGAEANEALIKIARKFGEINPGPSGAPRREIISFNGSFHGRTTGGMAATAQIKIKSGFGPLMEGFKHVDFNDISGLEKAVTEDTAAILLEPIQGEGGINVANKEFLLRCESICNEKNILLLFDEVQCGIGRCGALNGWQAIDGAENIMPDAVSWAKAMGGGFPIGAVWIKSRETNDGKLCNILGPGSHGSTFGGSPLASAVSCAVLRAVIDDDLATNTKELNEFILDSFSCEEMPLIKEIRGKGLMIGFVLDQEKFTSLINTEQSASIYLVNQLAENGLLTVPAGPDVIRWLPALNVHKNEVKEAIEIMRSTFNKVIK